MGRHLLLTVRLHGDGEGAARFHGMVQGSPEWPPSPARVFQALVAGNSRGDGLSGEVIAALEWLERLPPPVIAVPRAHAGSLVNLYVPNNDADAQKDPRDVSNIRVKKVVHPTLFAEGMPFLYAWPVMEESTHAAAIVEAALNMYQLGRGIDMAWAVGELVGDGELERRLREHGGTVHSPQPGRAGKTLACPMPGSLASLEQRHRATRFVREAGASSGARLLFSNAPKPRFLDLPYERARSKVVFELRDREDEARTWPRPLHRVVELIAQVRDGAAARLREALPDEHGAIERTLIGRKADGSDPGRPEERVRLMPLPSIGHEHADHAVRRILLDLPTGTSLRAADVEWALSGLVPADPETGAAGPFVLTRTNVEDMLRHYVGPSRMWRSITAVALPDAAARRRIEPARRREEAKPGSERIAEEGRAVAALHVALRHAGIRATMVSARVQREPFEAQSARVEAFAEGTRFTKERLWHVELQLDRSIEGPLVLGDGRFLGLGLMAPFVEARVSSAAEPDRWRPVLRAPTTAWGILALSVSGDAKDDPLALAHALRRAVIARAQAEVGDATLGRFFTGHEESGTPARADHSNHIAFHWDPARGRLLAIAPHWLDRRDPTWQERRNVEVLSRALEKLLELRAGPAGRFAVQVQSVDEQDPLLVSGRSWTSLTPYAVTRHKKRSSAAEVLLGDVVLECRRRGLPRPTATVFETRGVAGRGLEGYVRLDFEVAVPGPIILGRTRYLGGGLFAPLA